MAHANTKLQKVGSRSTILMRGRYREQCGENLGFALRAPRSLLYTMLLDDGCARTERRRSAGGARGMTPFQMVIR